MEREPIFDISNLVFPDSLATFRHFGYPKKLIAMDLLYGLNHIARQVTLVGI